jgi:glucose/arabinose dehydrogenase
MKMFKSLRALLLVSILMVGVSSAVTLTPARAASIPSMLNFTPIANGLTEPVFITNAGDNSNRLFILQQTGQIRILKNGSLLPTPFIDISGLVSDFTGSNGEQGLLGLAFDPSYTSNGYFYITYTTNDNDPTFRYTTTLARYHVSSGNPDLADTLSGTILLSIPKKYTNHNGGMIAFGPDGYLYMSMGDGGSGGDPDNNAQNLHTLLGKLLRLDVNATPPPGQKYVIPSTNPFYGNSDPTIKQEIWAYGLRNPWRFSFDRLTGDLYIGDVGQNIEEEVDFQTSSSAGGQNYGWHILEGNLCYNPSTNCIAPSGYVPPVATYDHGTNDSFGCAITGGYVYRGIQSPSLQGTYFYGDYCSGKVLGLIKNPNNTWTYDLITSTSYLISSFGQDEQGELYITDYVAGTIYHISAVTFTITGNAGVPGATLEYMNDGFQTVTANGSGDYSVTVPAGWGGLVTPYMTGYTFSPVSRAYSNIQSNQTAQNYNAQVCVDCADVSVTIGGSPMGDYTIRPSETNSVSYETVNSGPVSVFSNNGLNLVSSERVNWLMGYDELMGYPADQLTTEYLFPWYNNVAMNSQLRVGNTGNVAADVDVYIGDVKITALKPYTIPVGGSVRLAYTGVNDGPVRIVTSTVGASILASERVIWLDGYDELMGYPVDQLTTEYLFPWYNNVAMNSQLRVANTGNVAADVEIYIGNVHITSAKPYTIPVGGSVRLAYAGVNDGPVRIVTSTAGASILASERVIWLNGYDELMGYSADQLTNEYVFPLYDNVSKNSQLRIGNTGNVAAEVDVYLGDTKVNDTPYSIPVGGSRRLSYTGLEGGPLRVVTSTAGASILATERVINGMSTGTGYDELMGYASNALKGEYLFPWYNNVAMSSDVIIGVP